MNRGNPASSPPGATPGAGSPGNNTGSGGAAHPYPLPYSAGGGGHYPSSYMSTGPYPDPGGALPGGPYEPRLMEYGGKYQFSGFQQTPYYNNQPSPNEEGSGAPAPYYGAPGSMGSPTGGRDLNYFGYNNGFGAGGESGGGSGPTFYPQQQQQQQQQHDNNNKTLGSDTNIPVSSSGNSGPSEVKSEVDQADPLSAGSAGGGPTAATTAGKDNIPELSDLNPGNDLKFNSARGHPAILGGSSNTELSDTKDNSDNQSTRSHHEQQSSPNPNSPRSSVAGVKRSHSPSTNSENNDFGSNDPHQQQQQPFEAMGPSSMNHGDEYMRQMSTLNPQNEGMYMQMQYPPQQPQQQQQMWDSYYNYPGQQAQPQQQQQGMHMQPHLMDNYGMPMDTNWWQQQQQQQQHFPQQQQPRPEFSPNFRAPMGMQAPGAWVLRGPKPRNDRRGPGRPRIGPGVPKPGGSPGSDRSIRPRLLSPPPGGSYSPFASSELGSPASEVTPGSPSPSGFDPTGRIPGDSSAGGSVIPTPPVGSPSTVPDHPVNKSGSGSKAANANKKRYTCEVCQKRFSTAWYVRVHRKSHSGERPYICHNCGKGFMLPNVLQVHLRKCEKNNPGGTGSGGGTPGMTSSPGGGKKPPSLEGGPDGPPGGPPQLPDGLHKTSPLPQQQGFLEGGGMFNNGSGAAMYNQRYDGTSPMGGGVGGMPTPPFLGTPGEGGPAGGGPGSLYEQYGMGPTSDSMSNPGGVGGGPPGGGYSSSTSGTPPTSVPGYGGPGSTNSVPAHFLANDKPPDKGGGHHSGDHPLGGRVPGGGGSRLKTHPLLKTGAGPPGCPNNGGFDTPINGYLGHHPSSELPPSPSFSSGIPTPQSSLDSLSCYPPVPIIGRGPGSGVLSGYSGSDPLSELTATVEAAVPIPDSPPGSSLSHSAAPPLIS